MGLSHSPSIVSDGLVFYVDPNNIRSYPGFGNTVYNLINSSIGGTLVGYTSALLDNTEARSFYFDGSNDSIPFTNSTSISPTKITVCIWFKKAHGSSFKALIDKGRDNYGAWSLCVDETANKATFKAKIFYLSGVNHSITTSSNYNSNAWNFVCGVYDGAYLSIYLNGVLSNTVYALHELGNNSYPVTIGAANDGYNVNANIGQAFIYEKALSAADIQQLYNATRKKYLVEENIVTNGLIFNIDASNSNSYSGAGNTIYDLSGSGITGALTNGPTYTFVNNGSIVYDGTNDYINITDTNLLTFGTNSFTIDFWIYITSGANIRTILSNYSDYMTDFGTYFYLGIFNYPPLSMVNKILLLDSTGNYVNFTFGADINTNQWTHIAFTRDGNSLLCYKNGLQVSSASKSNNFSGSRSTKIGGGVANISTLAGNLPSTKIYNRALSGTEIQQNYNATKNRFINVLPSVRNGLVLELDAANTASYSGSGNTWYDLSGNSFNSTLVGSPSFSGVGSSSYITFDANTKSASANTSLLSNYSSGTIECSVYITNTSSSFIFARQRNGVNTFSVLSVGSYTDSGGQLSAGSAGTVYYHNKNAQTVLNSSTALLANTWYRLSITFTTSSVILYINGIQNATVAGDYSVPNDASTDPRIGAWIKDGTNYPMNGRLAHFTIYNRALSAYEIKQNFDFYRTRYGI
jgi:hypothetical protein